MITPADLAVQLSAGVPVPLAGVRRGRLTNGSVVDLEFTGGRVARRLPADTLDGDTVLDLSGFVVLPAAADAHAHLDKANTVDTLPPAYGDLRQAIEQWNGRAENADEQDYHRRARQAALELLAHGVTAIRSHCNLTAGADPLVGLRALLRLRAELAQVLDLQIAVLPGPESPTEQIVAAMEAGADLVGGCPHLADDPEAELDRLLEMAHRFGTGIDIHADEQLTPTMLSVAALARKVRADPLPGTVTAGHCVSLGTLEPEPLAAVVAELAAAGVAVVTLPITNLYLQGWDHPAWTPRGLTAVRALLDAGVVLAAGGDNIRDPFNPVGRADPLETVALLVVAGHLSVDEALTAATAGSRAAMGLPTAGTRVGDQADLLACQGFSLLDVVARAPEDRIVIHRGAAVSATATSRVIAVTQAAGGAGSNTATSASPATAALTAASK